MENSFHFERADKLCTIYIGLRPQSEKEDTEVYTLKNIPFSLWALDKAYNRIRASIKLNLEREEQEEKERDPIVS